MAEKRESNNGSLEVKVDVDCTEALKGLKAITRAAKKATAALKELEEQQNKLSGISISFSRELVEEKPVDEWKPFYSVDGAKDIQC
ncbi:hypothetical protein [Heyndrickxia shackletonii]|uniref:hypothetical protein n=1 Tax=Heyndrickxia shackletonii TaxID=157838 RepID=UPI0006EC34DD|nr:hypothetical protein [Heyndrickxia shackletonii]NEY99253.1 hypothetical protein [Heyndrickxia shackletonii]